MSLYREEVAWSDAATITSTLGMGEESLLESWMFAVNECTKNLTRNEQAEISMHRRSLASEGREVYSEHVGANVDEARGYNNCFSSVVKRLIPALRNSIPQIAGLELVQGGAYLAIKHSLPSPAATERLTGMINTLAENISLLEVYRLDTRQQDMWLRQLIKTFVAVVTFWSTSVPLLRRSGYNEKRLRLVWVNIQNAYDHTLSIVKDSIEYARVMKETGSFRDQDTRAVSLSNAIADSQHSHGDAEAAFPVYGTRPLAEPRFFGRSSELQAISTFMTATEILNQTSHEQKVFIVTGIGGVGKTALAVEYVKRAERSQTFDAILWFEAESEASIRKSFTIAANDLLLPGRSDDDERNHILVKQWLNRTERNWLIIYDNVIDSTTVPKYLPKGTGSIMITTRIPKITNILKAQVIELRTFSHMESVRVFNSFRGHSDTEDGVLTMENEDDDDLKFIIRKLDGLALGIKQVARYIHDSEWTLEDFRMKYKSMTKDILDDTGITQHTLANAWNVEFADLMERHRNAHSLLGLISLVNADDIPTELVHSPNMAMLFDSYEFCGHEGSVNSALLLLRRTGLVRRSRDQISIHRLLQSAFKYSQFGLDRPGALQTAIGAISGFLNYRFPKHGGNKSLFRERRQCSKYLQHVQSLAEVFDSPSSHGWTPQSCEDLDELFKNACWYLFESGMYQQCSRLLETATRINTNKDGLHYATLCQTGTALNFELNDLPACRKAAESCILIRKTLLDHSHPDVANAQHNLGNLLVSEGRYDEAISMASASKLALTLDDEHDSAYTGIRELTVSRAYLLKDNVLEARRYLDKAFAAFRKAGPIYHFYRANLSVTIGNLELHEGNNNEAFHQYHEAHQSAIDVDQTQPFMSIILYKLAIMHIKIQEYTIAREHLDRALQLAEYHQLEGQKARVYRMQWKLFDADPDATAEEKSSVPDLQRKAEAIRRTIRTRNAKACVIDFRTEDDEYDSLVCSYFV